MKLRTVLFWLHLCAGVAAGVVILVMSVTGTLLTFQQTILRTVERSQRFVDPPSPGAARLPIDAVLEKVRAAIPDAETTAITFDADPRSTLAVAVGPQGTAFVNPYTGEVLGTGSARARGFYRIVTGWHRYLAMTGDQRATGRMITGACNAAFLVLAVSGLFLWWPRQWTVRHVGAVTWFRRGLRGRARDFNWHNTIGFWCAPVLIVLTTTGMVISYAWASNLVYTMTGSPAPTAAGRGAGPGGGRGGPAEAGRGGRGGNRGGETAEGRSGSRQSRPTEARATPPNGGPDERSGRDRADHAGASTLTASVNVPTDELLRRAQSQVPTWSTIALRLPPRPGGAATATISDGAHWNRFARSTLTLDSRTGAATRWEPYAATSAGQKLRGWMRFAHTGELGGPVTEAIAGLACLGGAFLVYTGFALSLRRLAAWRARRSQARAYEPSNALET